MLHYAYMNTPVGVLTIAEEGGFITNIAFGERNFDGIMGENAVISQAKAQLEEYFAGARREFDLPLDMRGTDFQKRVWSALLTVPYGRTAIYKDIAIKAGSPKGARAVGMANNKNPIVIVVPCHRIVGADGSLVGFAGGIDTKRFLLELEKKNT